MTVEIYTKDYCPFCIRAKRLLDKKGVEYIEYDALRNGEKTREMILRSGRYTVPQIFIGNQSIGGSDELIELDQLGKLDEMLSAYSAPNSVIPKEVNYEQAV